MCSEKVAQTHKRADSFYICGWFSILDCFQLVFAWFDTLWSECETQVGYFLVTERALV